MTVMWCASSFSCYVLNFLNKYLEGTIYQNSYSEATAGIISCMVGSQVYAFLGKKVCFFLSWFMALTGGIGVYLLEAEYVLVPAFLVAPGSTKE